MCRMPPRPILRPDVIALLLSTSAFTPQTRMIDRTNFASASSTVVVMWVEANSPSILCVWEVGVTTLFIMLIMLTSLMPPILAFSSTRLLRLYFAFGVGLSLFVTSLRVLRCMVSQRQGFLLCCLVGMPLSVWALLALSPRLGLGPIGSLHGFYKWAVDTLALLNEFVLKVVRHRQTSRLQAWSNWIREDLTSHPYQWLRPEFVPPAPYLVCKPEDSPNGSGILVQPALIDAHYRKAWMPYFRRDGHPVVTAQAFLEFVGDHLPQETFLDLPILRVRIFMRLPWPRNPLLAVLMAGPRMRFKRFLYLGLSILPWFFSKSKLLVSGLRDSLMRILR